MDKSDLTTCEFFALHSLMRHRPLFKWEINAMTEGVMLALERKGLIFRDGEEWKPTLAGCALIGSHPISGSS